MTEELLKLTKPVFIIIFCQALRDSLPAIYKSTTVEELYNKLLTHQD